MFLPEWIDLIAVTAFSLVVFYYAVSIAMKPDDVQAALRREAQLEEATELNLAG